MVDKNSAIEFNGLRVYWIHERLSADLRHHLVQFWLRSGALSDISEAWRRTFEVGCVTLNRSNEIVGVSSFYIASRADAQGRYFFLRAFVRPDCRIPGLMRRILLFSYDCLADYAQEPGAPRGVILEAENPKLAQPGVRRVLQRCGFVSLVAGTPIGEVWLRGFGA
jgi:hypothetical protein